jgi:hypothetical protein
MVIGVLGKHGDLVLLPVVEEHIQETESVIILPQKMEELAVTLMDLLIKSPKVVTAELVLVYVFLILLMHKLIILNIDIATTVTYY